MGRHRLRAAAISLGVAAIGLAGSACSPVPKGWIVQKYIPQPGSAISHVPESIPAEPPSDNWAIWAIAGNWRLSDGSLEGTYNELCPRSEIANNLRYRTIASDSPQGIVGYTTVIDGGEYVFATPAHRPCWDSNLWQETPYVLGRDAGVAQPHGRVVK